MIRNRTFGRLAASLLLTGLAASPLMAQDTAGPEQKKQKVIIITESRDGAGEVHAGKKHHGTHMLVADCVGDKDDFAAENSAKGEKARVVICSRGNVGLADRAKRLESVLARINSNNELSTETRAKISTAIRGAIERLNTAP
jgi:hypothetical protein